MNKRSTIIITRINSKTPLTYLCAKFILIIVLFHQSQGQVKYSAVQYWHVFNECAFIVLKCKHCRVHITACT